MQPQWKGGEKEHDSVNFEKLSCAINLFNSIPHRDFREDGWVFNVLNNDQN